MVYKNNIVKCILVSSTNKVFNDWIRDLALTPKTN